ncbi:MAG TPA: radical SAM protein [Terriglobales bacterium]|jgi:radical SAM protein with 4Fe4S-binding SPASM domain|nr:radical SAM protein [Terriglobales bacterium]
MSTQTYGAFSQSLHQRHAGQRAPLEVSIEMTRRCPLECKHCYNNLPMGDLAARNRELSKEEHFGLLDQLVEMGAFWLLYTGGEIFARKDFLEIYTYAKQKGFLITLFTNGILINERIADYLVEYPPFGIEITLYGHTKKTYEALTGIPGSYERCLRGIELLRERGLPLKLKTVPTTINRHEVFAMKRFAEEELGVDFKFDGQVNPRIDCSQSPLAVRLSPEDVVAIDMHSPKAAAEYRQLAERDLAKPASLAEIDTVYFCGGGMNSFAVNAYGQMSICVISQQETYDIRQGSVREGWEKFLLTVRNRKRKQLTKCVECKIQSLCGMCPANGELENGDKESPVAFLCEAAHLRALALELEVPAHGDCEFCHGGSERERIGVAAHRIRTADTNVDDWMEPVSPFQVLGQAERTGCGSCGASH